ncbi:MAG: hypothetical protein QOK37_1218 [Thermoanaerobaculia bacterium]|nr:hypothetical protein [Thermoanaerobaculia bacterium]
MKSRVIGMLAAIFVVTSAIAQSTSLTFYAALTGANVVGGAGSPTGFGSATLTLNGDQATIDLNTYGLTNITSFSLYQGPAGSNGTLIQAFIDAYYYVLNGRLHRIAILDPVVAAAIAANPQNYYLAIATGASSNDVVRGQLSDANTTYVAGAISGSNPICSGNALPNASGSFVFAITPDPGGQTYTVRYDLVTRGLGTTITFLQIGGGKSGPGLFTVGGNATSTDGRFSGATQISSGNARLLQTLPDTTRFTVTTPATGIECAAAGPIFFAHEVFIPVAGTVRGVGNANYMTDLNVVNNTAAGTNADILTQYFPAGGSTATASATSWSTITPHATATYRDLSTTVLPGMNGIGALRIVSTGNLFANARIYNNLSATGGGTFGQFVPALPRSLAQKEGTLLGLTNIVSGSSSVSGAANARTNIGLFNPGEAPATLVLELRNANGLVAGQRQLTLMPWMQLQMPLSGNNGLFNTVAGDVGSSSVYFLSGSPVFVYASVIDNTTADASYVTPSVSNFGGSGAE